MVEDKAAKRKRKRENRAKTKAWASQILGRLPHLIDAKEVQLKLEVLKPSFKIKKKKLLKKIQPKYIVLDKGKVKTRVLPQKYRGVMTRTPKKPKKERKRKAKKDAVPIKTTLLMRVEISDFARQASEWYGLGSSAGGGHFKVDMISALETMYYKMYRYVNDKKSQLIPTNTGALKRSLLRSLTVHKGDISTGILIIEIGTHLPYLEYVHEMETRGSKPHLRHPPYAKRGGGFTRNPKKASYLPEIDDPQATKHFLDWIIIEARKAGMRIFNEGVVEIYNKWKTQFGWTSWTQAKKMFEMVKW